MIMDVILTMVLMVYVGISMHIGIQDYREWRDRKDFNLNVLRFPSGAYPKYTKGVFGIHNIVFLPSLVVIGIGIVIYIEMQEW